MNREEVRVISLVQARAYIKNGLQPIRVEADDVLIFVFDKEASKPLFQAWKDKTIKF